MNRLRGGGDKTRADGATTATTATGDADDYDPYDHREREQPTNDFETLAHLVKGALGTGILALPEAFMFAGMLNGIVSTILIGILGTYCYHVLARSQYVLCKKIKVGLLTYPESMRVACETGPECLRNWGAAAALITDIFLMTYQFGVGCVYIVFVGVNVKSVVDVYTPSKIHLLIYFLALFVPFVLIFYIRNLKYLAPFSTLANIIAFITYGVVIYYVCQDLEDFNKRPKFGNIFGYPLYFGTALFALQSVGVTVAAENNMKTPRSWRKPFGVLNIGMGLVTVIYLIVGMLGYWRYGDKIQSTITLNFPINDILSQVIKILYSASIFISFSLNEYVGVDILWGNYLVKHMEDASDRKKLVYEYLLRTLVVVILFVLASSIPLLGLIISLMGCVCLTALGIAFPAMLEICAYWPDQMGKWNIRLWKDIVLLIIGIVGLGCGTYSCISEIVLKLMEGHVYD